LPMTWSVTCPRWESEEHKNKAHTWLLPLKEAAKIGNRYFDLLLACFVCDHKFSLQEGVKESFLSDNPFVIHDLQQNAYEHGAVEVTVGQLKTIRFSEPFEDTPKVYLTPYEKPATAVPGRMSNTRFSIFSCDSGTEGETRKIGWIAYGNRDYATIPIWRKLLSSSKEHQLRKDFRSELVDLESAFEVFIAEYLGKSLKTKFREGTVDWILKLSIEEELKIGFIELTGEPLPKLEPEAYGRWQRSVKELRDSVVHRGAPVTARQAREARGAMFELMTRVDPTTIDYFARKQ
jgi:hypothetical protein